jgi:hypothetical protein
VNGGAIFRDQPGMTSQSTELDMRKFIVPLAISVLTMLASVEPSSAEITYPWCAQYGGRGGRNCGFSTFEQCRATVFGTGGYCEANPMFVPLDGRRLRRPY